jgi:hypothetical protein
VLRFGEMGNSSRGRPSEPLFNQCAYCGEEATTKDHTPPRNLLRKPLPSHTVTVWACEKCNSGFSFDEMLFKVVLAYASSHPELIQAVSSEGSVGRALSRDANLRGIYEAALDNGRVRLTGDLLRRITRVLFKTVQGLHFALYGRFVPVESLELVCFQNRAEFSLQDLVNHVRPPQVLDMSNEPLPDITPSGWARKGQGMVVTMKLTPTNGGESITTGNVLWFKQETPIEWVPYQEGIFKFGFVGTADKHAVCAMELWETFVIGVRTPWPSGRGNLRRGRSNPFSRERRVAP